MKGKIGPRFSAIFVGVVFMATGLMGQTELLPNGDFHLGDSAWVLAASANNGANAAGAVVGSEYVITITNAGYYEYSIQFADTLLTILNGHTYHIQIKAKSSIARPFTFGVGMTNSPWTTYSGVDHVGEMPGNLTTDYITIDTNFAMTFPDDMGGARIFLNFGHATAWPSVNNSTVTISKVSLIDMTGSKIIGSKSQIIGKPSALSVNSHGIVLGKAISPFASLKIFSVQGKLLEDLSFSARKSSQVSWNTTGLKSGSFIVRLVEDGKQTSRKAIITQ
jgi:hypothetical protein